jgi:hypothetical protein
MSCGDGKCRRGEHELGKQSLAAGGLTARALASNGLVIKGELYVIIHLVFSIIVLFVAFLYIRLLV